MDFTSGRHANDADSPSLEQKPGKPNLDYHGKSLSATKAVTGTGAAQMTVEGVPAGNRSEDADQSVLPQGGAEPTSSISVEPR